MGTIDLRFNSFELLLFENQIVFKFHKAGVIYEFCCE